MPTGTNGPPDSAPAAAAQSIPHDLRDTPGGCGEGAGCAQPNRRLLLLDPMAMTRQSLTMGLESSAPDLTITPLPSLPSDVLERSFDIGILVAGVNPVTDPAVTDDIARLQDLIRPAPVAVIAGFDDIDQVVAALEMGVRGYLTTDLDLTVAAEVIRLVCAGGSFVPARSLLGRR